MRKIIYFIMILPFIVSCNKTVNNEYVTAIIPKDYHDITDKGQNDILQIVKFQNFDDKANDGGLQSILSIDNIQEITIQPNSQTTKESTPKEILTGRLSLIEKDTYNSDFEWKNFKIIESPKETNFKGYPAAEAVFLVEETYQNKKIDRKIKRIVVFVKNDLWNIVLAPTEISTYNEEMKVFDEILNGLIIK